jgi:hypothetical protein
MGGYANTLFLPDDRHFGLALDLDGSLFKFPYVGLETFVGDLAELDVFGARFFVRPLLWLGVPIIKNLQVGASVAMDVKPYLYDHPADLTERSVAVYGVDARLPILSSDIVSLAVFSDVATIDWDNYGGMIGVGGRLLGFLTYGVQLRALQNGFIPTYFDAARHHAGCEVRSGAGGRFRRPRHRLVREPRHLLPRGQYRFQRGRRRAVPVRTDASDVTQWLTAGIFVVAGVHGARLLVRREPDRRSHGFGSDQSHHGGHRARLNWARRRGTRSLQAAHDATTLDLGHHLRLESSISLF